MKNVGRYPDLGTSLAHRALAEDRLNEVSMTYEQIQQILDGRVANYVTEDEVNTQAASKLSKSALATHANNFIDQSQIGTTYASLVGGKLPSSQLPSSSRTHYLESAAITRSFGPTSTSAYNTNKVACGTVDIPDVGYSFYPLIYGSIEVQFLSGAPPAILTLEDNEGRVVAGGMSTRSQEVQFNRINVSPEGLTTAYYGSWTYTWYIRFREGTGQVRPTQSFGDVWITLIPWMNS